MTLPRQRIGILAVLVIIGALAVIAFVVWVLMKWI